LKDMFIMRKFGIFSCFTAFQTYLHSQCRYRAVRCLPPTTTRSPPSLRPKSLCACSAWPTVRVKMGESSFRNRWFLFELSCSLIFLIFCFTHSLIVHL